jgi:trans-2,3-dihydro-3-hydroxyanthranilate isomerase
LELSYHVVDVFTTTPLEGNALAVFPDASGLETGTMQRIARELNLSETAFIFPKESSPDPFRVRIFTPASEMEFAGHPTIGTAYVIRRLGMVASDVRSFALKENVGRVPLRVGLGDDPILWLTTPPIEKLGEFPRSRCASMLSLDESRLIDRVPCELLSAGNPNLFIAVDSAAIVDEVRLVRKAFLELAGAGAPICVFVFAPTKTGAYSRMFAPELGVTEDPATGSATGPLAAFMMSHGLAPSEDGSRFISEQGVKMGRRSLLHVYIHGAMGENGIEVGGNCVYVTSATLHLNA